ncbi:DivIVA domain-containing protein [Spongisporangium articulatum]|uniref:DivIVA domain-containing protein n=1 Tax=Spongisporangium articulatum TaxID=3362603 RepID=A0ABW8AN56_9ACTN
MTAISDPTELETVLPDGYDAGFRSRLSPEIVRQTDFPRTQLGRRGYNEADVERFRNRVIMELVSGAQEKAELRQEIQRLRDYYRRQGVDPVAAQEGAREGTRARRREAAAHNQAAENQAGGPSSADLVPTVEAVNVMSRAQQVADQHVAQAEDYARRLVANAREQYEEILVQAHETAERAEAEVRAAEEERAMLLARSINSDGRLDPGEVENLRELASRLAYMRTFAQVTQVQLRSILDALSDELGQLAPVNP